MKTLVVMGLALAMVPSVALAAEVGEPAPEIGLDDQRGNRIGIAQFRGKVLVLTTWASWCEPCQHELPALQRMYARLRGRGLRVVGVNVDRDPAAMQGVVGELGLTFPNVHDPRRSTALRWGATMMPSVYVVGPDGVVRYAHMSYRPGDERVLEREAVALLPRTRGGSGAETETESGTETETESGTETETESESESEIDAVTQAEAETESEPEPASGPPPASPSSAGRRGGLCSVGGASPASLALVALVAAMLGLARRRAGRRGASAGTSPSVRGIAG